MPRIMDDVLVYHTRHTDVACCRRTVHARILALYLPGARNGLITKIGHSNLQIHESTRHITRKGSPASAKLSLQRKKTEFKVTDWDLDLRQSEDGGPREII